MPKNPFNETPHGLSPEQVEKLNARFESFLPRMASANPEITRSQMLEEEYRKIGAAPVPYRRTAATVPGATNPGQGTQVSPPTPYQPEFSSVDRQCFAEGTNVVMADGTWKVIEEVKVGDRVLDGKGRIATVEHAWCEGVPEELVQLRIWGGRQFLCTKNHRWPVWRWLRKCLCGCGTAVKAGKVYANHHHPKVGGPTLKTVGGAPRNWKRIPEDYEPVQKTEAGNILPDDLVLMPRKFDPVDARDVTDDRARLLGYYVAEGSPSNGGLQTKFSLNASERDSVAVDISEICARLGVDTYVYDEKHCKGIAVFTKGDLRFGDEEPVRTEGSRPNRWGGLIPGYYNRGPGKARELQAWLEEHAGHGSSTKCLSEEVMRWPARLKLELIRGAFIGDGTQGWREVNGGKGTSFTVSYITTSSSLAAQLELLLTQLGFPCRSYSREAFTDGTGTSHRKSYQLEVNGDTSRRLATAVWQERSRATEQQSRVNAQVHMLDDDFAYARVKAAAVVPNTRALRVYNLSVSGDHSYLVENVATFNSYPVHRILSNRYWRLFHKLDPVIGNVIDMYSTMPWSGFQLIGEGVEGSVKEHFEAMCEEVKLLSLLPYIIREFLTVGEAIPHCMYDADKQMWNYVTMHNPDSIEVIDAPFIKMDPIIQLIPDQRLRSILSSGDPLLQRVRAQLPPELLNRLLSRQNIPLDSLNCSLIARKLHPYDVRGTSILSRLWRVLMLEDGVFNATIATARRHAGPIKIAKLGNPQTGWIPGPEHEQRLLELLAQAELDPHSFIVYHFGVQFEAFGTTDRVISVGREWETLERIKLVGLGVSKSFISGEVSYASSVSGIQVFLQRLLAQRNFIEDQWIYPKFFKPIAELNDYVKPTSAELNHRIRVRRTAAEINEDQRYIVPKISWDKTLDPQVDRDMIAAMESLSRIGVKFSKKTMLASAGLKFEDELKTSLEEDVHEVEERQKVQEKLGPAGQGPTGVMPSPDTVQEFQQQMAPPKPPRPPQAGPLPGETPPAPAPAPEEQEAAGPAIRRQPMVEPRETPLKGKFWRDSDHYKNWSIQEAEDAAELFRTGTSEEAFWTAASSERFRDAVERGDPEEAWADLELYLEGQGYPDEDISDLRDILVAEWILRPEAEDFAKGVFDRLPEDIGSDQEAEDAFLSAFQGKKLSKGGFSSSLLVGDGNAPREVGASRPFRIKRGSSGGDV